MSQVNYNLFDIEVGAQQSQFAYLQAKDLTDALEGLLRTHDKALWNGTDTSLTTPTTLQYYGAAQQINDGANVVTIGTAASIVDGIKSIVATMVSNTQFEVRPTAIYSNPVLLDLIDREMKASFNVVLRPRRSPPGCASRCSSLGPATFRSFRNGRWVTPASREVERRCSRRKS